ncbi:MAG TPA: hypothetical protein VGQ39_18170 [Pyrinomonadaceae bacterium]|jgi:hypothetical protein|nr:hypothetical protein [Pyrinomonadaceae bacterium]
MKRCPACSRVETDEALGFCRVDGTPLVIEVTLPGTEVGTAKFGRAQTEIETSLLPHSTDASINRATGPTTVLASPVAGVVTQSKRIGLIVMTVVVLIAAALIASYLYLTKKRNAAIQSIAVMPFVNAGLSLPFAKRGVSSSQGRRKTCIRDRPDTCGSPYGVGKFSCGLRLGLDGSRT